jgi:hypothetical protein
MEALVAANDDIRWTYGSNDTRGDDDEWNEEGATGNDVGMPPSKRAEEGDQTVEFSVRESVEEVWGDGDVLVGNITIGAFPHPSTAMASILHYRSARSREPVAPTNGV